MTYAYTEPWSDENDGRCWSCCRHCDAPRMDTEGRDICCLCGEDENPCLPCFEYQERLVSIEDWPEGA